MGRLLCHSMLEEESSAGKSRGQNNSELQTIKVEFAYLI